MNLIGGFKSQQAHDALITKVEDRYDCGLCKAAKKAYSKAKGTHPVTCASFTLVWQTLVKSDTCHKYPTLL